MSVHAALIPFVAGLLSAAALSVVYAAGKGEQQGTGSSAPRSVQSDATVEQMMRADVNKDGVVTKDEVDRMDRRLGRRFGAADADRDGKLTLREFEKLRELSKGATSGTGAGGAASGGGPASPRR